MFLQTNVHSRRQFLERSMLGFGSAFVLPSLLASCTDHLVPPNKTPVAGDIISKGVDYYAYFGGPNFSVTFRKPIDLGNSTQAVQWPTSSTMLNQMLAANLQIAESDIGLNSHTGRFQWHLFNNGAEIAAGYAEIAPSTGNLGDSTISNMLKTPSIITGDYSISYGFYDSGPGFGSLTDQDQFYMYATANRSNWMGNSNPSIKNAPLNRFVLPGAHDAGMFDPSSVQHLLASNDFKNILSGAAVLGTAVIDALSSDQVLRIVINLAFTQKDTIVYMLNLGIRYFDFRPGYSIDDPNQTGKLYHQHNFIPGYGFEPFIQDICQWLHNNPSEIVVVALGHSGFNQDYMKADPETLWNIINQYSTATNIGIGNKRDLFTSYSDLIQANKRLIVLGQYGFNNVSPDPNTGPILDAVKYDSYTDAYQTTDVNVIINALNNMGQDGQNGVDYTVLQLQGTASGTGGGIFDSVATLSNASSPLLSTKAQFDNKTYPWIQSNGTRFSNDQLLVCLNDFADNALTEYCIDLTRRRAG